jgi:hypothetical protein
MPGTSVVVAASFFANHAVSVVAPTANLPSSETPVVAAAYFFAGPQEPLEDVPGTNDLVTPRISYASNYLKI